MRLFRHPKEVTSECRGGAVAIGNFDGVHLGHQAVISRAFALGRANHRPVGVLTFEPHPRAFFKPDLPPFRITPFRIKMRVLQALGLDFVCCLAFDRGREVRVRCAACRLRTARGFGWFDPRIRTSDPLPACSMRCMSALCRRWGVVDPDEHEIAAIAAASEPP